jgi:lipocalin
MRIVSKLLLRTLYLSVLLLLIIQSCSNINILSSIQNEAPSNSYLGEWYSVARIQPFGAILSIDSNYTFTYEGGACVLHFASKGQWIPLYPQVQNDFTRSKG